jgi:hypothetical protein
VQEFSAVAGDAQFLLVEGRPEMIRLPEPGK